VSYESLAVGPTKLFAHAASHSAGRKLCFCVLPAPNTLRKDALLPIRTRTLLETALAYWPYHHMAFQVV